MTDHPLEGILEKLSGLGEDGGSVDLKTVVHTLETRGFGPLLMVLSALMMLPVGMLPGFPAIIGLLFVLCGAQMIRGKSGVWIPDWLGRREMPADKLRSSIDKVWPMVRRLRKVIGERMSWAVHGTATRLIAIVLIVAGLAMIGLGFVPGLPFVLALPVLLFGIGLTAGDGLVVVAGFVLLLPAVAVGWMGI
ncbi:exopolysaccharide biosynthesis protein [Pelagovum pacificum]|uniref:Exopolysaccharide biosynthesis protein n=1 Tax=Pelagovum pacificum TaxID=2588711 RepID=A0A5C5GIT9_9RHOB|nr:exopolysaccharide biosynthesis protein [Pelagovum pacificum]QQA43527.1 exopolysaccharide biosynthesis protein [Pelagovum pacificum]TNY33336.1 exopolysaccharide biosynthesis protein [Pelagovum pacificum]